MVFISKKVYIVKWEDCVYNKVILLQYIFILLSLINKFEDIDNFIMFLFLIYCDLTSFL